MEAAQTIMDNKGQAVVETVAASMIAFFAVGGLFFLILLVSVKMISHRILYEAMICEQLRPKLFGCRRQAEKKLREIQMGSKLHSFYLTESSNSAHSMAFFELPFHFNLKLEDSLKLPLIEEQKL